MKNHKKEENFTAWYTVPALITGLATGYLASENVAGILIGAIVGLLFAAFWINVAEPRGEV